MERDAERRITATAAVIAAVQRASLGGVLVEATGCGRHFGSALA